MASKSVRRGMWQWSYNASRQVCSNGTYYAGRWVRFIAHLISDYNRHVNSNNNKKDHWDSGKPRRQHILFCDIQTKVVISHRQIHVYHTDLLLLKI